jgi:uncharacterized protein
MRIQVERLAESPTRLDFEVEPEWWSEVRALMPEFGEAGAEPPRFEVETYRMGADVYLEGSLSGAVELRCGRCTRGYRQVLGERFRLVLEPAGARVPSDPEGAAALARDGLWLSDELEAGCFRGPVVNLGGFFREVLALALPVQPLCREDCRGLCPRCGIDRNEETCACEEGARRSPFAALAALRPGARAKGEI